MILTAMAPDRFYRFFFTARYLQALCPQGLRDRSILDIGSNENVLADFLDGHPVIQIDQTHNKLTGLFAQSLAEKTPFKDQTFDFSVCLDVLEHTPVNNRPVILSEIARVTSRAAIVAFPVNHSHNTSNETNLSAIHLALTNESNKFLSEHKTYGLVDWQSVLSLLSSHFAYTAVYHTFPSPLWLTAHLIDYCLGMLPETQPIRNSIFRCINHLPIISDDESKTYRTFIVASHSTLPAFDNKCLEIPDEDYPDPDLVEAACKSHEAIVSLNDYAIRLENTVRETSAQYSALENHFLDTKTDLENHRILNRNLEISSSELKNDVSRISQELDQSRKSLQDILRNYDSVDEYAIDLENALMIKDRMITDLQSRITRLIKQLSTGRFRI